MIDENGAVWPSLPPGEYIYQIKEAEEFIKAPSIPEIDWPKIIGRYGVRIQPKPEPFREWIQSYFDKRKKDSMQGEYQHFHLGGEGAVDQAVNEKLRQRMIDKKVEEKLALIEQFGADEFGDGAVIRFKKRFKFGDTTYTYAAIKVNGKWYTTGPKGACYTWDELVGWLISGDVPTTEITPMVPVAPGE